MEQHPVPRNISGFQFRLIGDMTLKQFAYLSGGIIIAFLIFKSAPLPSLFKYLFAGIFALSGVLFAFLPIQERPLDKWLLAFIKSIYSPSQYLWKKEGILPSVLTMTSTRIQILPARHAAADFDARMKLRTYLNTLPKQPHQTLNIKEKSYMDKTLALFSTIPVTASASTPTPTTPSTPHVSVSAAPAPQAAAQISIPAQEIKADVTIQQPIEKADAKTDGHIPVTVTSELPPVRENTLQAAHIKQPETPPVEPVVVPQPISSASAITEFEMLKKKLEELAREKEKLANELEFLKSTPAKPVQSGLGATIVKPVVDDLDAPTIKSYAPKTAVEEIGIPNMPQFPNLLIGVVKDEKRLILPNILITIKDKNGVPLRALKTNKLGQFATATPLPNGTYLIEIEDPLKRFTFDVAEVVLSGKIFLPIEVTARSQKEIMREQLSKALFSNPTA